MATLPPLPLPDDEFTPEEHDASQSLILLKVSFGLPFTWANRRKRTALRSPPRDNAASVGLKRSENKPSKDKKSQHLETLDRLEKKNQDLNRMILGIKDEVEFSDDKHHSEFQPLMQDQTAPVAERSNNNRVDLNFPLCEPSSSYGPTKIPD